MPLPDSNHSFETLLRNTRPLPLQSPDYWRTRQIQLGVGVGMAVAGATVAYLAAVSKQPLPSDTEPQTPPAEDILPTSEIVPCEAPPPKFTPIQIDSPSTSLTADYLTPLLEALAVTIIATPVLYLLSRFKKPSPPIAQPIKLPAHAIVPQELKALTFEVTNQITTMLVPCEQELIPFTDEAACFLNRGVPLDPGGQLLIRYDTLPAFKHALEFIITHKQCPSIRLQFYLQQGTKTTPFKIYLPDHERWLVRGILDRTGADSSYIASSSETASSALARREDSLSQSASMHATSALDSYLASLFKAFLRNQRHRNRGEQQTALALARREQRSAEHTTNYPVVLAKKTPQRNPKTVRFQESAASSSLSYRQNFYSKSERDGFADHSFALRASCEQSQPKALTYQASCSSAPVKTEYEPASDGMDVSHSQRVDLWNSLIDCELREEQPPDRVNTWNEWFAAWGNTAYNLCNSTWVATKGWMNLLVDASWHSQHPAHHQKYYLALEKQKEGFHRFLEQHITFKNTSDDFLRNLEAKINRKSLEKPYNEFFKADTPELYSHLHASLIALLNKKDYANIRHRNYEYLFNLRNALGSKEYKQGTNQDLNTLLRQLCFYKFHENDMTNYEEAFLEEAITTSSKQEEAAIFSKFFGYIRQGKICLNKENIAEMIRKANDCLTYARPDLRKAPQDLAIQKLENELGVFSDPLGTSNIPEVRSIHEMQWEGKEPHEITYLRHGSATYELGISNFIRRIFKLGNAVPTVPEYGGFLDAMQEKDLNVLYVNHQNMAKAGTAEANRAEAIAGLEKYPNFHFLSLPMDLSALAPVLDGKRVNDRIDSLMSKHNKHPLWIYSLLDALVQEDVGFLLPQSLIRVVGNRGKLLRDFLGIAGNVKRLFFNEGELEDRSARLVFLMIFYSYIKEYIKGKLDIRAIASVCKDAKDRANAAAAVDEALHNLRLGRENDPKALYDLFIKTLSPFIIKYEQIIPERLELLLNFLEKIANLSPEQKKNIRNYTVLENYTVVDQRVPRSGPRSYEPIEWSKDKIQDKESLFKTLLQIIDQDHELHAFLSELVHGSADRNNGFKSGYWDPINEIPMQSNKLAGEFKNLLNNEQCLLRIDDVKLNPKYPNDQDYLGRKMRRCQKKLFYPFLTFASCLQLPAVEKARQCLADRLRKDDKDWAVHLCQETKKPIRINGNFNEGEWRVVIEQDVVLANKSLHLKSDPIVLRTTITLGGAIETLHLQGSVSKISERVSTLSSSRSDFSRG